MAEMTAPLSDTSAPDLPVLSRTQARRLTSDVKRRISDVAQRTDRLSEAVRAAYCSHAWEALGYPSWDAYVDAEFEVNGHRPNLLDWAAVGAEPATPRIGRVGPNISGEAISTIRAPSPVAAPSVAPVEAAAGSRCVSGGAHPANRRVGRLCLACGTTAW